VSVLVLGGRGQVGRALERLTGPRWTSLGRAEADVTDPGSVARALAAHRPEVVVNLAAWTAVDAAEQHPEAAWAVNAAGAGHVADACAAVGARLIQVSTEMVFGEAPVGGAAEDGELAPLNAYGRAKAAGEAAVRGSAAEALIVRSSWVFSRGWGFGAAVLARARAGGALEVVADRVGTPTAASDLARALVRLAEDSTAPRQGTLHVAGAPAASWRDIALALLAADGLGTPVAAVSAAAWSARHPGAPRARDARLACQRFTAWYGGELDWRAAVVRDAAEAKEA
jgi:dTDP-4-dehydrorhamnose reductase